jgi:hypothetical protein
MAWLALPARALSRAKMRAADNNTKTLSMADHAALPTAQRRGQLWGISTRSHDLPVTAQLRRFQTFRPCTGTGRGVRSRAIGVPPCSPRPQGTAKSSRFHNFRASTQKGRLPVAGDSWSTDTICRIFRSGKRIVFTWLQSSAAALANKGPGLLTINATGAVVMLTFCDPVFAIVSSCSQSSGHAYIICK